RPALPPAESARQAERRNSYHAGQFDPRGTSAVLFFHQKDSHKRADEINNVRVVDATTGAVRGMSVRHAALVREVVFSPDGRHFATASFDGTARVWATATGRPAGPPLLHGNYVTTLALRPDGNAPAAGDNG